MQNYNIYLSTEREKYIFISAARAMGANITGVSGCGSGYYIQLKATAAQAHALNDQLSRGLTA